MKHSRGIVTFQDVATRYARVMGRKNRVHVTFGGSTAYTDGSNINLPALPAGTTMTPHQYMVMGGYLDHETSHLRYTNFEEMRKHMDRAKDPLLFHLWNVFEDVRCENRQIEEYPGSRAYLDALAIEVDQQGRTISLKQEQAGQKMTMGEKILTLIYKEAYKEYRGIDTNSIEGDLRDYPKMQPVLDMMQKLKTVHSTVDTIKLAKEVKELLPKDEDYSSTPPPISQIISAILGNPGGGNCQGGVPQSGNPGTVLVLGVVADGQNVDANVHPNAIVVQPGPIVHPNAVIVQPVPKDPNQDPAQPKDPGTVQGGTVLPIDFMKHLIEAAVKEMKIRDRSGAYAELINTIREQAEKEIALLTSSEIRERKPRQDNPGHYMKSRDVGTKVLPPVGTEKDQIFVPSEEDLDQYKKERNDMKTEILATRKMLNIFLRSRRNKSWFRDLEEGKLDNTRLFSDSTRCYKQKRESQSVNTAIGLMIDLSGSMNAKMVREMTILIAEATNGIKYLKIGIFGFGTNGHDYTYGGGRKDQSRDGGRAQAIDIEVFKGFEEPYHRAKGRLGAIGCDSATPLGDGYAFAYEALLKRKEPKKVLMLLTDGEPAISIKNRLHSEQLYMKQIHARCKVRGIKTIGIGVGQEGSIKKYTDQFILAKKMSDMSKGVMSLIKNIVLCQD